MVINHENNAPKVSVIMPCYNNADFLKDSIDSVLNQNYPNIEVIVIDDGSTDDSFELLQSYGNKIITLQQKNQGPAAARNYGIRQATGDFIAFNDCDDIWLPGKIAAQVDLLSSHSDYIACYCNWVTWNGTKDAEFFDINNQSNEIRLDTSASGWLYIQLLERSIISTISIMIRKNIVTKLGFFNEKYLVGEDYDYWIRMSRLGQIAKIANVLALYRFNINSTTKKIKKENFSLLVLQNNVKKYGLCDPIGKCISQQQYRSYLAERHFTYGYHCFWAGEKYNARYSFLQCLKNRFFIYKSARYLFLSYLPFVYEKILDKHTKEWAKRKSWT